MLAPELHRHVQGSAGATSGTRERRPGTRAGPSEGLPGRRSACTGCLECSFLPVYAKWRRGAHWAVIRLITISATTPEHASTTAAIRGSASLPPVSGSGLADAEALVEAEALAEAPAVEPVPALSCTRSTSRLS